MIVSTVQAQWTVIQDTVATWAYEYEWNLCINDHARMKTYCLESSLIIIIVIISIIIILLFILIIIITSIIILIITTTITTKR